MDKQINPNIVLDTLFEKVQELTREDIIKSAYVKQLEEKIEELNKTLLDLTKQLEVANNNNK